MAMAKIKANDIIEDIVKEILDNVDRVARDRGGQTPIQRAVAESSKDIRDKEEVCGSLDL